MKFYICELRYMYNKKHGRFNEQKISVYQTHILIKKKVSNNHKKYVLKKIIIILFQPKITLISLWQKSQYEWIERDVYPPLDF